MVNYQKNYKVLIYLNGPGLLHFTAKDGTRTTKSLLMDMVSSVSLLSI